MDNRTITQVAATRKQLRRPVPVCIVVLWLRAGRSGQERSVIQLGDVAVYEDAAWKMAKRALFFLPTALYRAQAAGITDAAILHRSKALREAGNLLEPVGRDVIEKVLKNKPVTYSKAKGFTLVLNAELSLINERERIAQPEKQSHVLFEESDWISCVFRLRDTPEILSVLELTEQVIADGASVDLDVVVGALDPKIRFCLTLVDGLAIWAFLLEKKKAATLSPEAEESLSALSENPADLLATDDKYTLAVRTVASPRREDGDRYVYGRHNLRPAPVTGHPWALDILLTSSSPIASGPASPGPARPASADTSAGP